MAATYRLLREPVPAAPPLELDDQQRRVVEHARGPLLVLAGPGTGKTATLVEAVARRVEAGADPERLLLLTFSRRAAGELRERIGQRLGARHVPPTAWTFHAFCLQVLTRFPEHDAPGADEGPGHAVPLPAPGLLGEPDQDLVVRELLRGDLADGRAWPSPLGAMLDSRGVAAEVRALIARAQSLGLGPDGLAAAGVAHGRVDWQIVADFYGRYLDVLGFQDLVDYGELVTRAAYVAGREQAALRAAYEAVWVDEYQDTDPQQEALLRAVAGDGGDLVVVGDPDQSIYAFRGAEVAGILQFPDRFRRPGGDPAPIVALQTCRRSGSELVAVGRRIAETLPTPGLPVLARRAHRALVSDPARGSGHAQALVFPSPGAEADGIADLLRRAHLDDGLPWTDMAVLVRSGRRSIPLLRRVLGAAGVPVEVAGDELPLAAEPAVAPLLTALRCADDPAELTDARTGELLASPLVGADAGDLRRAARLLRQQARAARPGVLPPTSARALRDAVLDPLTEDVRVLRPLRRLGDLLRSAHDILAGGGDAEDALWQLWSVSGWPRRLADRAGGRGPDGRAADRDLDTVLALFTWLVRAAEQRPHVGVSALLETLAAQAIPAGTQDERGVLRPGVRLLTAHRSKGLEWPLVVVAGVQEGSWPDLRSRGSLLAPDALRPGGRPGTADLLADERRLFYVAATRARDRLVVTAVDAASDDGNRPSRFLAAVAPDPERIARRPERPRTLSGLVGHLRALAVGTDEAVAAAAAARLAALAAADDDAGTALVPAAHPDRWWGLAAQTAGPAPYPAEQPLPLSTSSMTALADCPLQWYLAHELHADSRSSPAAAFGNVVHALADALARGTLSAQAVPAELDRVWPALGYEAPWQSENERRAAHAALARLAVHLDASTRRLLGTEVAFDAVVEVPGGQVRVRGRLDRVEVEADGTVVVVDLKTSASPPPDKAVAALPQLRLYQYAVESGLLGERAQSAGAELWQLRADGVAGGPKVQTQAAVHDHTPILLAMGEAREQILAERFPPVPEEQRCGRCAYEVTCPARPRGAQVLA